MDKKFTVGELKKLIAESSNQFKPVIGNGVENDNKKNNEKSYKDIESEVSVYTKGMKTPKAPITKEDDHNRTTLDYNPETEPSEEYKKRIQAQAEGYTSELEKSNGNERVGDFDGAKEIYKAFTKKTDEVNKKKEGLAHAGLKARELPKNKLNTLHEENMKPKAKRLTFKHTKFINEQQVLVRIPEQYKIDGQVIHMCDNQGNEYIVECTKNQFGNVDTNIVSHSNKKLVNEQMNRIQELMGYKSKYSKDIKVNRIEENKNFGGLFESCKR